jgi:hypothetical protein
LTALGSATGGDADRFGFYDGGALHMGASGQRRPASAWGPGGRTSGVPLAVFNDGIEEQLAAYAKGEGPLPSDPRLVEHYKRMEEAKKQKIENAVHTPLESILPESAVQDVNDPNRPLQSTAISHSHEGHQHEGASAAAIQPTSPTASALASPQVAAASELAQPAAPAPPASPSSSQGAGATPASPQQSAAQPAAKASAPAAAQSAAAPTPTNSGSTQWQGSSRGSAPTSPTDSKAYANAKMTKDNNLRAPNGQGSKSYPHF